MSNLKENNNNAKAVQVSFAALNPRVVDNIVRPTESTYMGRNWVSWGDDNAYPDYLLELYKSVPTLASVINGTADFVCGDGVEMVAPFIHDGRVNRQGMTVEALLREIALSKLLYNGFALQVIRDASGEPCEVYPLDMRFVRTNKECDVFYYSEGWKDSRNKVSVYPKFLPYLEWGSLDDEGRALHASSIIFHKSTNVQVYPMPLYASAVLSCEIEKNIDIFHLNSIHNGFVSSMLINFNNGMPTDKQKAEIERDFGEKFTGAENAGRVMFSYNKDKENAATIEKVDAADFGDKYTALEKHSRQQIFTAFRANPNLFGIPTDNNGFSNEEYEASFKLYNRTRVRPIQMAIVEALAPVGAITIQPFTLE